MAEQQRIPAPASNHPDSFIDEECCDSQTSSTNPTFPFPKLPKEIQYQIFRWAVGNRTLHVQHSSAEPNPKMPSRNGHLYCYSCHAQSTQFDVYNSYAKLATFRDKIDSTAATKAPCFWLDQGCKCLFRERAQYSMDLRLLSVSREIAREAQRLFYSSNTWRFNRVDVFRAWLAVVPPEKLALVTRLHLVIRLNKAMSDPKCMAFRWKAVLSDQVVAQLPNLRVVHLEVYVYRSVLAPFFDFSRQALGNKVANLFRPLQRLGKLRDCTVVMKEEGYFEVIRTKDIIWDGDKVGMDPKVWARKEALSVWAEDIRRLVLSDKSGCRNSMA